MLPSSERKAGAYCLCCPFLLIKLFLSFPEQFKSGYPAHLYTATGYQRRLSRASEEERDIITAVQYSKSLRLLFFSLFLYLFFKFLHPDQKITTSELLQTAPDKAKKLILVFAYFHFCSFFLLFSFAWIVAIEPSLFMQQKQLILGLFFILSSLFYSFQ